MFGIFGKRITERGRDSVVLLGMLVHFVTFFLILLNMPDKSPNNASHDMGYLFHPRYGNNLMLVSCFIAWHRTAQHSVA